jgi:hypothetical protein
MPQVKKICVDSRFANALSKSNTDFKMDLTDSINFPITPQSSSPTSPFPTAGIA